MSRKGGPATGRWMAARSVASGSGAAVCGRGVMTVVADAGKRMGKVAFPYATATSTIPLPDLMWNRSGGDRPT